MKTSDLTGTALDWAVAKIVDGEAPIWDENAQDYFLGMKSDLCFLKEFCPSTNWAQGGPINDRESISVFRIDDEHLVDERGFCTNEYRPIWGAVVGLQHSAEQSHNGYGEPCGLVYEIAVEYAVEGPTALIAAMRCFVASKLGDTVEIPKELQ